MSRKAPKNHWTARDRARITATIDAAMRRSRRDNAAAGGDVLLDGHLIAVTSGPGAPYKISWIDEDARRIYDPDATSETNREGLTWPEWYRAAGFENLASIRMRSEAYFDWQRGVDPSEWRRRNPENEDAVELDEDDITTEDHRKFWQNRKLVVTVPEDEDWEPYVIAHMQKEGFFPNVWFISDHGNLVLLDPYKKPPKSRKKGKKHNPNANPSAAEILDGMTGAIWVTSYADWVMEQPKAVQLELGPSYDGDWADAAPAAPPSAEEAARDLYLAIERANGKTVWQLLGEASRADAARISPEYADAFGHYLAMQAMGTGTSWFDDHARFPLKMPPKGFEAHTFDGETVEWSPRIRSTQNPCSTSARSRQ